MKKKTKNMKIIRVLEPKTFFKGDNLKRISDVVRKGFGTEMTDEDIYQHLVSPDRTYVFRDGRTLMGMASLSDLTLLEKPTTYLEGIALSPEIQGKGIGRHFLSRAVETDFIVGKTQNPNMYSLVKRICSYISPDREDVRIELDFLKQAFGEKIGLKADELGVVRGVYGKSLYSKTPKNKRESPLFDDVLKVNYQNGDSVLFAGRVRG